MSAVMKKTVGTAESTANFSFTPASLESAGIPPEDIEFYMSAHINYKDGSQWQRFLGIQHRVAQYFEQQEK